MKTYKISRLVAAVCITGLIMATTASAITQLIPTGTTVFSTYYISKNGTGPGGGNGNDSASNLYRLQTYFTDVECDEWESFKPTAQSANWASGLSGWDYAVIHYGGGAGYGGSGGSIGAYAIGGTDSFNFPSKGFSSIDLYRCKDDDRNVPDGGSMLALLGGSIAVLGFLRRKIAA